MKRNFEVEIILLYALLGILYIALDMKLLIYIAFGINTVYLVYNYFKLKKTNIITVCLAVVVYSCILPDNYTIILLSGILMVYYIYTSIRSRKIFNENLLILIGLFMLNFVISDSNLENVLFFIIFDFTFILYYFVFKNRISLNIDKSYIDICINNIIVIQVIATIAIVIFRFRTVISDLGGDWSVGTFGAQQGNILMLVLSFTAIRYLRDYRLKRERYKLVLTLLCAVVSMSTGTITNNIFLVLSIFIYVLTIMFKNFKESLKYLAFIGVIVVTFFLVMPEWVKTDLYRLTNPEYLVSRVRKLQTYRETFTEIPTKDIRFLLAGNGAGYYSSRAALTTTGYYIRGYNKIFNSSMSYYTRTKILSVIVDPYFDGSILSAPFSTVISIMGEFGVIGVLMFFGFFYYLFRETKEESRVILLFFLLLCFNENWIEFGKVALFFWMSLYFAQPLKEIDN
jgi:hypothetical protein